MKRILILCLLSLLFYCLASLLFKGHAQETETEQFESTDYIGDMDSFTGDQGTSQTNSGYCSGDYCTGHKNNPGTYDKDFDLESQMSISEINAGFDMKYGVDVTSHSSNARLATCASITQNRDCRDIFKLTISLFDNNAVVQKFEHEVELDFSGTRAYDYSQTIAPNSYQSLTGNFELYGVDAGYGGGWYGPKFADPYLTTHWEVTTIINEEIINLLEHSDILDTSIDYDNVVVDVQTPEGEVFQEFTIEVEADMDMAMTTDVSMDIDMPQDFDVPVIEEFDMPDVDVSTDVEAPATIEANVEQEMEVEVAEVEAPQETEQSEPVEEVVETETETTEVAEAQPEAEAEEEVQEQEPTKKQKVVAKAKQKVANKIVKNMGDKGKYDSGNQIKTLVVMQVLGNTNTFFNNQVKLQDIENFFTDSTVPDAVMSDDNYAQYFMFGGSDVMHDAIVDQQYK